MELFDNFIVDLLRDLPKTDFLKIYRSVKLVKLNKNEVYLQSGFYSPHVFYVKKGLLRGYYLDEDGEEKTLFLRWQKEFGSDPACYFDKKPARLTWEALEKSELLEINYDEIQELGKRNIFLLKIMLSSNQKLLKRMYERVEDFIIYNPEERFKVLLNKYPNLYERVPDKHLASFLGITPVSLSRIKKRIEEAT